MRLRAILGWLIMLLMVSLGCNLTSYRPTPQPPSVEVGAMVNPFIRAGLDGATAVQIQAADPMAPGGFTALGTATDADLAAILTALNVSVQTAERADGCPDHLRLIFVLPDAAQVTLYACLDGVVRLRGLVGAEGLDVPMYGAMSDALSPYLTESLNDALDF